MFLIDAKLIAVRHRIHSFVNIVLRGHTYVYNKQSTGAVQSTEHVSLTNLSRY